MLLLHAINRFESSSSRPSQSACSRRQPRGRNHPAERFGPTSLRRSTTVQLGLPYTLRTPEMADSKLRTATWDTHEPHGQFLPCASIHPAYYMKLMRSYGCSCECDTTCMYFRMGGDSDKMLLSAVLECTYTTHARQRVSLGQSWAGLARQHHASAALAILKLEA